MLGGKGLGAKVATASALVTCSGLDDPHDDDDGDDDDDEGYDDGDDDDADNDGMMMVVMVMVMIVANSVLSCRLFKTARCSLSGAGCTTLQRDQRLEWCRLYNTAQGSAPLRSHSHTGTTSCCARFAISRKAWLAPSRFSSIKSAFALR